MPDKRIISPEEAVIEATRGDPYCRAKHARYLEPNVVYHVISRTRGNLFLLRPDQEGKLRAIVAGILANAKAQYPGIANYATTILSNHLHALLRAIHGDPREIADYIAYLKRELTRRWKHEVNWSGSIWGGYACTAIITPSSQKRAFRYLLSQGVKENLIERPQDWPGFHCAESLVTGKPIEGEWFNGTAYGKAFHAEKIRKNPREVRRSDFLEPRVFSFDQLPALSDLTPESYRGFVGELIEKIVEEGSRQRNGKPAIGVEAICAMSPLTASRVELPPWFEDRKRMIVWDDLNTAALLPAR